MVNAVSQTIQEIATSVPKPLHPMALCARLQCFDMMIVLNREQLIGLLVLLIFLFILVWSLCRKKKEE